jgi:hypothetical protein
MAHQMVRKKSNNLLATTITGQDNPDDFNSEAFVTKCPRWWISNRSPAGKSNQLLLEEASMNIDTTVWYHIVNANSNRMLEVPGEGVNANRLQNGLIIRQGDLDNSADTQWWSLWKFVELPSGQYDIFNKGSGRCMVIQNGNTSAGTPCWQYGVDPQRPQEQWIVTDVPNGNGKVYLINVLSNRYIEIENSGTAKGDQCQQWDNTPPTRPGAQWLLMPTVQTTVPRLTLARLDGNQIHHNRGVKSTGVLSGENLTIGSTVDVTKANTTRTWTGVIEDNYVGNADGVIYWRFSVKNKTYEADPIEDDTLSVTVTNIAQQTSNPIAPSPPASDVP